MLPCLRDGARGFFLSDSSQVLRIHLIILFTFDYICACSEIGVGFLKLTPDTLYTLSCLVMIQALNSGGQIRELLGRRRAEFLEFQSPSLKCSKATVTV